ncbi:CUB and sushi domain-containing protein 3 [Caerostris darwini]|uniref:CUB and sushi domain-containing protein 3 n=1 Tax=Caerostris darwini TaxID=1538125 RepID=A0AAV4VJ91_9ARAC|nr:CUB and sushi domain-containing protein 3 [Caerostris darwini]
MCGTPGLSPFCSYSDDVKKEFNVGDTVTYTCSQNPCYMPNNTSRQCLENGTWSGGIPICYKGTGSEKIRQLSILGVGKNLSANLSVDNETSTCTEHLVGNNPYWEAILTKQCRIVAVMIFFQENARASTTMVRIFNENVCTAHEIFLNMTGSSRDKLLFTFPKGPVADKVLIYPSTESNRNNYFQFCEVYLFFQNDNNCLRPDIPYKGRSGHKTSNPTAYNLECSEGYELVGDRNVLCQQDGTWAPSSTTCRKNSATFGTLVPVPSTLAQIVGTRKPQTCIKTQCGELPSVANGGLQADSTSINSIAWLNCNEGFRSLSANSIRCLPTGLWESASLRCGLILCDENPNIPHGKGKLLGGNAYGSKLSITCDTGYGPQQSELRECNENGTWGNLNICTQITCDPSTIEVSDGGQWVSLNETVSIRVLICQTDHHMEGSPAVTQCLPNGSWSYTTAVCKKTPKFDAWNSEWTPSTILLSAVAVGAGTAVCILCLAMCFLVIKKRRQSKTNSTVFHIGVNDPMYYDRSKEQFKANTYEDIIELRHNPSNIKPKKPNSALPLLPIPSLDTDPVYAQPFETSAGFSKLPPSTAGDIYTAHIYAEPVDSHRPTVFNSTAETWLRSGAKKVGRKMSLPGRASLPEDTALQRNQNIDVVNKVECNPSNISSSSRTDEKHKNTEHEPKTETTVLDLITNSIYLDTKDKSFNIKKDWEQLRMIDNDIYQDDYISNV